MLFGAPLDPMLATWGLTPLMAAVLVGAAQNVFSKSSKYSLFDPCKEMAYIPLDQETQVPALLLPCHMVFIRDARFYSCSNTHTLQLLVGWRQPGSSAAGVLMGMPC